MGRNRVAHITHVASYGRVTHLGYVRGKVSVIMDPSVEVLRPFFLGTHVPHPCPQHDPGRGLVAQHADLFMAPYLT